MAEATLRMVMAATLLAACAASQVVPGTSQQQPRATGQGSIESPWGRSSFGDQPLMPATGDRDLDGITSRWTNPGAGRPTFLGFPSFPAGLGQFAPRPVSLSELIGGRPIGAPGQLFSQDMFVPIEEQTGWPAWARLKNREPLPYQPDMALLVQGVERVWWKDVEEDAFVPLEPYDKLRGVTAEVEIEVRQTGEFELMFHGGSRLRAQGPTRLRIDQMDEEIVGITLLELTHLSIEPSGRRHRITLPDGSVLDVAAVPLPELPTPAGLLPGLPIPSTGSSPLQFPGLDPNPSTAPSDPANPTEVAPEPAEEDYEPMPLRSLLVIERQDEPGWRGGRATIWNAGGTDVEWRHAFGVQPLDERERVTLFFSPQPDPIPPQLRAGEVVKIGTSVRCLPDDGGAVSWSGARFRLPPNGRVRFDPVQGRPFETPLPANR